MTGLRKTMQIGSLAIRYDRAAAIGALILLAATGALAILALSIGGYPLGFNGLVAAVSGRLEGMDSLILLDVRLPRLAAAIISGLALGAAGALFQALLRNPLATPDILGFTAGAGCGAVAVAGAGGASAWLLTGALSGGIVAAAATFLFAYKGGLSVYRLVLVGVGMSFLFSGVTDYLLSRTDLLTAADAAKWLAGSINVQGWSGIAIPAALTLLMLPLVVWLQFLLDRMRLGDDMAVALGVPVNAARWLVALTGIALTAIAVSVAGPLPFVAFISGPIAKRFVGTGSATVIPASLVGAFVTVAADIAARNLLGFVQLPTGIFTALVGAPYFLALLFLRSKSGQI